MNQPIGLRPLLFGSRGDSSFLGGTSYTIQFFANPTCNPNGYGEGRTLIATYGGVDVPAPGWFFVMDKPVPAGQFITATATDELGNTSEFSVALTVT